MKAQFWSFDIIFAIIIFVFAVVILTYVWLNISSVSSLQSANNLNRMQLQLQVLGTQLLTPGNPSNWNQKVNLASPGSWENLSLGMGNGTQGALSQSKINELNNMSIANYQATKPALGISYDYYIDFIGTNSEIGINPANGNVVSSQVITIPAVLNGRQVNVQIQLWSNSTISLG